jgi:diguanylate cyclase (GGDEF)-like protein
MFKDVNDTLGHDAGDQLLRECAARMQSCIRESDCVGRIGGDEFVVFLRGMENRHSAELGAEKLRFSLEAPFMLSGREARISASIGIALFPAHGADGAELALRADAAMYRSKSQGRNRYSVYDPALDELRVPGQGE